MTTPGRLRRRSIIGVLPVIVMLVSWYARPGHYGFDTVDTGRPPR